MYISKIFSIGKKYLQALSVCTCDEGECVANVTAIPEEISEGIINCCTC